MVKRVIHLGPDGSPSSNESLLHLYKESMLEFRVDLGAPASVQPAALYTNLPTDGVPFHRDWFFKFPLEPNEKEGLASCLIKLDKIPSGIYEYYVEAGDKKRGVNGYLLKHPRLFLTNSTALDRVFNERHSALNFQDNPLEAMSVKTMVPGWMGRLEQWPAWFEQAQELGYNAIHLVPFQKSGSSNSPYSIADQLGFNDALFDPAFKNEAERMKSLEKVLRMGKEKYGISFIADVVWNHTAADSAFLKQHPEAGYNQNNSPHLAIAIELDVYLREFAQTVVGKKEASLKDEADLEVIMNWLEKGIKEKEFWQYYVIDLSIITDHYRDIPAVTTEEEINRLIPSLRDKIPLEQAIEAGLFLNVFPGGIEVIKGPSFGRYKKTLDMSRTLALLRGLDGVTPSKERIEQFIKAVNLPCYELFDQDLCTILKNLKNDVFYHRIDPKGPKKGPITAEKGMVGAYFTKAGDNYLANNGWVYGSGVTEFVGHGSRAYFRRDIIIWSDCVKLRYGKKPEDNPWLWNHMKSYTERCARLCQGLRIDNCHSTPLPVATYMLDQARLIRPGLVVMAELFTGDEQVDISYVQQLGLNLLIREALDPGVPFELSRLVHRHGGLPFGSLLEFEQQQRPSAAFFDCTHDNPAPSQKRTLMDALSTMALTSMAACAIGSVHGYDDCWTHQWNLVLDAHNTYPPRSTIDVGIGRARRLFNQLHQVLAGGGYRQVHVHCEGDFIVVHRMNPTTRLGYLLVAHTAFSSSHNSTSAAEFQLQLPATTLHKLIKAYSLNSDGKLISLDLKDQEREFSSECFPPGSVALFETQEEILLPKQLNQVEWKAALNKLSLAEFNVLLYKAQPEEWDCLQQEPYLFPAPTPVPVYCGLQGLFSLMDPVMKANDLGHPLCEHLRQGTWLMDYVPGRLEKYAEKWTLFSELKRVAQVWRSYCGEIKKCPSYLHPLLVMRLVQVAYESCVEELWDRFFAQNLSGLPYQPFVRSLALCTVQLYGMVPSAGYHPTQPTPSLAAGLPHFSTHHMRCWGRDTFISLHGLFLVPGLYKEAREIILSFAAASSHNLIPNLLDSRRFPRYNARDATWWFMQAVQDYVEYSGDYSILTSTLSRGSAPTLLGLMQDIMQAHWDGISFREDRAGPELDSVMRSEGFQIDILLDPKGWFKGGSKWNAGTWMDKVSEAPLSRRGLPCTPRDGAAIELVGLLASTLKFMHSLYKQGKSKFPGVKQSSYQNWLNLLKDNFESSFFYPSASATTSASNNASKSGEEGYYRDTLEATRLEWSWDEQLRPNQAIALALAPSFLFSPSHAKAALRTIKENLLGPLGMKTLDPRLECYRGRYDPSVQQGDECLISGNNYHQGPEWVWCTGIFLLAWSKWMSETNDESGEEWRWSLLYQLYHQHLRTSPWQGLTELTNQDGNACAASCPTQAWSAATILQALAYISNSKKSNSSKSSSNQKKK